MSFAASKWLASWSSSQVASNSWIRSPDGDDLDAERPDQFDGAGVDAADVRVGVPRRVLHRHPLRPGDQLADAGLQLLPAEVDGLVVPGQVVERRRLDGVDQLLRLAGRGDEVEPAAGQLLLGQPDDPLGEDVEPAEVVQQPAVEPGLAIAACTAGRSNMTALQDG